MKTTNLIEIIQKYNHPYKNHVVVRIPWQSYFLLYRGAGNIKALHSTYNRKEYAMTMVGSSLFGFGKIFLSYNGTGVKLKLVTYEKVRVL